jgi:hypothetical protein
MADDSSDTKGSAAGVLKLGLEVRRPRKQVGRIVLGYSRSWTRVGAAMLVCWLSEA